MRISKAMAQVGVSTVAIASVMAGAGIASAGGGAHRSVGPDYTYGTPDPFADATAVVQVVNNGHEGTKVSLHVRGVSADAGQEFGAHVHQLPCGPAGSDAGGHYQHAGATGTLEEREVWLDFTVNPAGNGHATAWRPWSLDQSTPRSVIIHEMPTAPDTGGAGARLACIDLDG